MTLLSHQQKSHFCPNEENDIIVLSIKSHFCPIKITLSHQHLIINPSKKSHYCLLKEITLLPHQENDIIVPSIKSHFYPIKKITLLSHQENHIFAPSKITLSHQDLIIGHQ